ncbi:MAG: hypothetical protein ACLFWM_08910 [Actinomycetota bacterium]
MRTADLTRWQRYFELRDEGHSVEKASRGSRIDPKTAWRFERGEIGSQGLQAAEELGYTRVADIEVAPPLSREAKRALDDFGYFRRRYFGRVSSPWQERAAYTVVEKLETPDREYGVINSSPGGGKSTLFTHDIPAWLIARNRAIRILLGSRTEQQAERYVRRLKKTLTRDVPMSPDPELHAKGLAHFADATLAGDYGEFKPEGRSDLWRNDALAVRQFGGYSMDDKEPTVSAYGAESGFLGGRFDFIVWDDLVDKKNLAGEALEKLCDDWVMEYETRLEPGGVIILQGQRMGPSDLYRFALDLTDMDGNPKYFHVTYPAHDDTRCTGDHSERLQPWPYSCLLDPVRIPWKVLSTVQANTPRVYEIQYQQKDGAAAGELVEGAWIDGGTDSKGVVRNGCLDYDRPFGRSQLPPHTGWSIISVDPSATNFWAVGWWIMDPRREVYELVEVYRRRMGSQELLSEDANTRAIDGLAEEIRQRAVQLEHPIAAMIIEVNAAQRYLMAQPHVQRWSSTHDIMLMPHSTSNMSKNVSELNITSISDFFRQGLVRLPYEDMEARQAVNRMRNELVAWPDAQTDDLVMMTWFALRATVLSYADAQTSPPRFERPGWVRKGRGMPSQLAEESLLPYHTSMRGLAGAKR